MDSIKAIFNKIDYSIEDSLNLKYDLIATSLLKRPNEFIGKRFKSSLVFPFLTIWSVRNDILSAVTKKKPKNNPKQIICEFKGTKTLMFYKDKGLYFIDKDFKKLVKADPRPNHRYDESSIMDLLLLNTFHDNYGKKRRKLKKLQKMRNHIDIIHGYTQSKNRITNDKIKMNHLYDLLDIYHEIVKKM